MVVLSNNRINSGLMLLPPLILAPFADKVNLNSHASFLRESSRQFSLALTVERHHRLDLPH